jgi:hypothetical protein
MDRLSEDLICLVFHGNEHVAALCSRWLYEIIIRNAQVFRWIRQLICDDFDEIRRLSFERLYHHVYMLCISGRRKLVTMSLDKGLREFVDANAIPNREERLAMVSDVLMYWSNTRAASRLCIHEIIQRQTNVHVKCFPQCKHGGYRMRSP